MGNVLRKATDSVAGYRRKLENMSLRHEKSKLAKKLDPQVDSAHVKKVTPKSSARLPGQGTDDQGYDPLMDRTTT
ncbi:uncharacterized protein N7498_008975 [Penicillium cinerascens]|uniref:Uncharacterized protein n=1 Tax=Penicillium cinerascens TaxID=70096 RepID=A0A9W9JGH5_9EURO|nr:uncharacterized protein N7498_008975 [Penicillium cinerascens]KAJ5195537.1 hypothetical protein N7498_008975 [Penicillium cinerascens]